MRILKFGGSSLADHGRIKAVAGIVKKYVTDDPDITVVVSAQSGVTNLLVKICDLIPTSPAECEILIREIEQRHISAVRSLIPVAAQPAVMAEIITVCNELSDIARGAYLVGEVTLRTRDLILSFGERLSAYLFCQVLKADFPDALYADARALIKTNAEFGKAKVRFEITNDLIRKYYANNHGLKIVTGFIASTPKGQTTTLGRNGSDYTASVFGAALDADAIEIWSDTNGVMTADPSFVKEAQSIGQLSYAEAMELSHFGAKVLFPASLYPAMASKIPIIVKNTLNPEHPGTVISETSSHDNGFFKGITSLTNICMITVEGSGMVGVAGISARLFSSLSQGNISVILISQASSEHSICIAVMQEDAGTAICILKDSFSEELNAGLISSINSETNLSVVAVVGENMRHMPGVAARLFSPLGRNGVNIKAISQGSSELNISFVIHQNDLRKTLRLLHQSLFNIEIRKLYIYVAGTGAVGSRLLEMIESNNEYFRNRFIDLQICGLINSRKMLIGSEPDDRAEGKAVLEGRGEKAYLEKFVETVLARNLENSVFVDVTAADEPVSFYSRLMSGNIAIVTANKRANTSDMNFYNDLHSISKKRKVQFHYETNVGAGLPVINVIRNILAGGDKVIRIDAVLSGTINWLFSEYDGKTAFSELVKIAKEKGYTEPDPRDDLSGMDVARKCLILARECGWDAELGDVQVDPLMPEKAAASTNIEEFFRNMASFDPVINARYISASEEAKKLRYIASVENGKATVSIVSVAKESPFYSLGGTENCIILTTNYYRKYPMVIKGPGAGVDVTAAGLLADIVRIAEDVRM